MRELSDEAVQHIAEALAAYLAKPGNQGAAVWFTSKDLAPEDRVRVLTAYADELVRT
jgi:hypothetical protein